MLRTACLLKQSVRHGMDFCLYIIGVLWYLLAGAIGWAAGALGYRAQHGLLKLRSHGRIWL